MIDAQKVYDTVIEIKTAVANEVKEQAMQLQKNANFINTLWLKTEIMQMSRNAFKTFQSRVANALTGDEKLLAQEYVENIGKFFYAPRQLQGEIFQLLTKKN